jgi:hypothetical protein
MAGMLRAIAAASILLLGASPSGAAGPNGECTCRYAGGDVIEGQTACIRTASGSTLARCEKVLNNTSWKFLNVPCPVSQARGKPAAGGA